MAISKVTLNGVTQMDVTQDTVVANHLLDGDTATGADGVRLTGTLQSTVAIDDTLSVSGDAADAKVTGDYIRNLQDVIEEYNCYDSLADISWPDHNWQGVQFTWDGEKYTATGTSTAAGNYNLYSSTSVLPGGMSVGDVIVYAIDSTFVNVNIENYFYVNGAWTQAKILSDGYQTIIPTGTTGLLIRFHVPSANLAVSGTCSIKIIRIPRALATSTDVKILLYRYVASLESGLFEHGGINGVEDSAYNQGSRIRTHILCNDVDIRITTHGGTERATVQKFNADGSLSTGISWTETLNIPRGTIFRLVLSSNPSSGTEVSVSDILSCFDIVCASALPLPPTTNGTYTLRCVVSNGTPTYSWVSV